MTQFDIEKQINPELQEVWGFAMIDMVCIFNSWRKYVKPKGKRKWIQVEHWDRICRDSRSKEEPELPLGIRAEALEIAQNMVKVKTWKEYKTPNQ